MAIYTCPGCGQSLDIPVPGLAACGHCRTQFHVQPIVAAQPVDPLHTPIELTVPLLISGVTNLLAGLAWTATCLGAIIGIPMLTLSLFEFLLYSKNGHIPAKDFSGRVGLLACFEIFAGFFNLISFVCAMVILLNRGKVR